MANDMSVKEGGGRYSWRIMGWGGAAILLLLPFLAMQITSEVMWDIKDFMLFAAMLGVAGGLLEMAARASANRAYRAACALAVAGCFMLIWVNLAVGVIGDEGNPLNLMYGGIILVALIGALLARFRAAGMAYAMIGAAIAQILVAAVAQVAGHFTWPFTAVYVILWLAAASLFRKAAR